METKILDKKGKYFQLSQQEIDELYNKLTQLVEEEQAHDPKSNSLKRLRESIASSQKKWELRIFRVIVTALTKCGKSTLINALLGSELMPTSNTPETARIVQIRHKPGCQPILGSEDEAIVGERMIMEHLKQLNASFRSNGTYGENPLSLQASLVALEGKSMGDQGFEILDTPGPNEDGADQLRAAVERMLDQADVIIYLLDYTKLKTKDERELLSMLEQRGDLLRQYKDRVFFVINKVDQRDRNSLNTKETAAYVADRLNETIEDLDFPANRVLELSAQQGLLARLHLLGKTTGKVLQDFKQMAFGAQYDAEFDDYTTEECTSAAERILRKSRLPHLEKQIVGFLYEERGRILIESNIGDLDRFLARLESHLQTAYGTCLQDQKKLRGEIDNLKRELGEAKKNLTLLEEEKSKFKTHLQEDIQSYFERFKGRVKLKISNAFDDMKGDANDPLREVINTLLSIRETQDSSYLQDKIDKLNKNVIIYLTDEMSKLRDQVELRAHQKQKELAKTLQLHVNNVNRLIEQRVGDTLDIKLKPVDIQIEVPSMQELHDRLKEQSEDFIQSRQDRYKSEDGYFNEKYSTRSMYKMNESAIRNFWVNEVDNATRKAMVTVDHLIKKNLGEAIEKAQSRVDEYIDGFIRSIEREMKEVSKGEVERKARIEQLNDRISSIHQIQFELERLKAFLEPQKTEKPLA